MDNIHEFIQTSLNLFKHYEFITPMNLFKHVLECLHILIWIFFLLENGLQEVKELWLWIRHWKDFYRLQRAGFLSWRYISLSSPFKSLKDANGLYTLILICLSSVSFVSLQERTGSDLYDITTLKYHSLCP